MKSAISYFVRYPIVSNLVLAFLFLAGVLSLFSLKRESFPRVNLLQVKVTTIYPGATPEDVEEKVTIPIEEKLREVDGLDSVRSVSRNSESEINIKIDIDHKEPDKVLDDIRRVIDRVTNLPAAVKDRPIVQEMKSTNFPILEISVYGGNNEKELQDTAKFIREELLKSPGVARVDPFAKRKKEWHVLVDPGSLSRLTIGFQDIANAVSARNISIPGGSLDSAIAKDIRTNGEFQTIQELENLPVRSNDTGNRVLVSQVAKVEETFERARFLSSTYGKDAIALQMIKKEKADIVETVNDLEKRIELLRKQIPSSISIIDLNNEGTRTTARLSVVITNSIQGLILVVFTLFVFLSLKDSLITSLSLPLALLGTLMFLPIFDISFNLVSMLGIIISLGMLVDNSIVISENIYRYKKSGMDLEEAVILGASELVIPIFASYLTTVAAFLPMAFMTGVMGKFVWQIPFMVVVALTMSLFESFFLLPARIAQFGYVPESGQGFGGKLRVRLENYFERITTGFENFSRLVVRRKYLTLLGIALIFISSLGLVFFMRFNLFPKEGIDFVMVKVEFPPDFTAKETMKQMRAVEEALSKIPKNEIISYTIKVGVQQTDPTDPLSRYGENLGMAQIVFIPETDRKRSANQIMKEIEPEIRKVPSALRVDIEEIVNGPPVGAAVTIAIQGKNYKQLENIAEEVKSYLSSINGVKNISTDYNRGRDEILLIPDEYVGGMTGIGAASLANFVRSHFEGLEASTMRRGNEEVKIRILSQQKFRDSEEDINTISVSNRSGLLTPVKGLAKIQTREGKEALLHSDFEKAITVTASIDENLVSSGMVNDMVLNKFQDVPIRFPGYLLKFKGEEESTNKSMASLGRASILAFFGIFAILAFVFKNYAKPIAILLSIPLGLVGVAVGFLTAGKSLSFLAMIGIIGLAGVIVNASIVLVDTIDELQKKGIEKYESLSRAAGLRLRPIVLTTVTTMAGLVPTAYALGGSDPILIPMTLALAWGLGIGTLGSLIFIPAIFSVGYDFEGLMQKLTKGKSIQKSEELYVAESQKI